MMRYLTNEAYLAGAKIRAAEFFKNETLLALSAKWPAGTFDSIKDLPPQQFFEKLIEQRYLLGSDVDKFAKIIGDRVTTSVYHFVVDKPNMLREDLAVYPQVKGDMSRYMTSAGDRKFKAYLFVKHIQNGSEYAVIFNKNGVGFGSLNEEGNYDVLQWTSVEMDMLPIPVIEAYFYNMCHENDILNVAFTGLGFNIKRMFGK